jgi:hypothetical protein
MISKVNDAFIAPGTPDDTARGRFPVVGIFVAAALPLLLMDCGGESKSNTDIEACISRGVSYFREIGSYPRLSDGGDAELVARDRCRRTVTAF